MRLPELTFPPLQSSMLSVFVTTSCGRSANQTKANDIVSTLGYK